MDRVTRSLLARAGEQRVLTPNAMQAALELSGLRPDRAEWRQFAILCMRFSAVLSLPAGVIFLVAFNWENLGLYARFGMVEAPLLAALILAWVKGADTQAGKLALMLAVLLTGGLLGLFGQTYQTGADLYELFFGWAALTLPWVLACRYAPCWALWLLLINVGIGLHAATPGQGFLFQLLLDRWRWTPWSLPYVLDVLIYAALLGFSGWKESGLDKRWLRRGVMAAAMALGSIEMVLRIADDAFNSSNQSGAADVELLILLAVSAGFGIAAYYRREDLFDFAVLALAWIVVTTTMIGHALVRDRAGIEALFFIAIYLIGASTAAVKGIAHLGRSWKVEEAAE